MGQPFKYAYVTSRHNQQKIRIRIWLKGTTQLNNIIFKLPQCPCLPYLHPLFKIKSVYFEKKSVLFLYICAL